MSEIASHFTASDGKSLFAYQWMPNETPKCILLIIHGMAEHAERYRRLAEFLNEHYIGVVAYDQRGHGRTVSEDEVLGHIEKNGWRKLTSDVVTATEELSKQFSNIPLVILGHSMGSLVLLNTMEKHKLPVAGWVLSALPLYEGILSEAGRLFSSLQSTIAGNISVAKLQTRSSFDKWNKRFKPNRTAVDWLSRDDAEVDKYVNDPACGFPCTSGFWVELLKGHKNCFLQSRLDALPADLPLYMFAGEEDPVVGYSKGFKKHESALGSRIQDFRVKQYAGGRHESLNETNREKVQQDLLEWLKEIL